LQSGNPWIAAERLEGGESRSVCRSCADLIRASAARTDGRVKPGHDVLPIVIPAKFGVQLRTLPV
jgi:hypothetical protein